jgi:hypothetical protein
MDRGGIAMRLPAGSPMRTLKPAAMMPPSHLAAGEMQALVTYLGTLPAEAICPFRFTPARRPRRAASRTRGTGGNVERSARFHRRTLGDQSQDDCAPLHDDDVCFLRARWTARARNAHAQLARPDTRLVGPGLYNELFTMHGTTMMLLFAVPVMQAVAGFLIPSPSQAANTGRAELRRGHRQS